MCAAVPLHAAYGWGVGGRTAPQAEQTGCHFRKEHCSSIQKKKFLSKEQLLHVIDVYFALKDHTCNFFRFVDGTRINRVCTLKLI